MMLLRHANGAGTLSLTAERAVFLQYKFMGVSKVHAGPRFILRPVTWSSVRGVAPGSQSVWPAKVTGSPAVSFSGPSHPSPGRCAARSILGE